MKTPRTLPSRFCNLDNARRRFGDRVHRLGAYLWACDPAADAALAELAEQAGGPSTHALVGRALDGERAGIPAALIALVEEARQVPVWVEWDRIARGGRFFLRTGMLGGFVLGARALIIGYASPGGNKPLVFSGRLREAAAPRLYETSRFVAAVVRDGGMKPGHEGWKITLRVRLMHAKIRRMLQASERWDSARWGLPINQHDMVATTLLFSVVTLRGLRLLGVDISPREAEDFMHLWRWVAHVIGVDPALMPSTEGEGFRLGELIAATQAPPDDDSRALTSALLEHGLAHPEPREREFARRTMGLARAICRHLLGDDLADELGVPRTHERFLMPAAVATVRALEQVRLRSPRIQRRLVEQGQAYWDSVVQKGLLYASTDFAMPTNLLALASTDAKHART